MKTIKTQAANHMPVYKLRIEQAKRVIADAEYILIGGGAGLSAAAGLDYQGKRFTDHFADFEERYGFHDMYSGTFYPFETLEELWAHWARHIDVNRFEQKPAELYKMLLKLVQNKDYFVITTNVESQFEKAGFPGKKIFEVQGNYAYLQCAKACHKKLYYNESEIKAMVAHTKECRIPSFLVPKCPFCGGEMDVNLRHNGYFVEDERWHEMNSRYKAYLRRTKEKRIVYLELGVGFNTPGIIRYPFEQMTHQNSKATLVRINRDFPLAVKENNGKIISFNEDMGEIIMSIQ